jgi:cell division protein FtsI/penicillin-binding protein 2
VRLRSLVIGALVLSTLSAAIVLFFYRGRLAANVAWDGKVTIEQETRLHASIFKIAQDRALVRATPGPQGELLLQSPQCEAVMLKDPLAAKGSPGNSGDLTERQFRTALRLLCESPQGGEILQEIEAWNAAFDMLGVRDNRFQDEACQSDRKDLNAQVFVPRDCKPNLWKVERVLESGNIAATWIPRAEPSPQDFSMIADPASDFAFFGDWAVLKSGTPEGGYRPRYRMHSDRLTLRANRSTTVEIVGRLRGVKVYSADLPAAQIERVQRYAVNPQRPNTTATFGPVKVEIFAHCGEESSFAEAKRETPEDDGDPEEQTEPDDGECKVEPPYVSRIPIAYQVSLTRTGGGRAAELPFVVELDAEPVEMLPAELRPDFSQIKEGSPTFKEAVKVRLTRHIEAKCPANFRDKDTPGGCDLTWERVPGAQRAKPPTFNVLLDADPKGENLVDPKSGIIKGPAFDEGLASIIGLGPQDWGSLSYALAHRSLPADGTEPEPVRLTIDPGIQKAARDAVGSGVRGEGCQPAPSTKKGRARGASQRFCVRLRPDQTATLIVLNADKTPGAIKGVASWPTLAKHLHIWDLQALESDGAGMASASWRLVAPDQRPGSTFKAITAMAALDLATQPPDKVSQNFRDRLAELLAGKAPLARHVDFLRLASATWSDGKRCSIVSGGAPNSIPVRIGSGFWCARNYRAAGATGASAYWAARPSVACGGTGAQFGVCEALMVSSNLFFGGLAEQMTRQGPRVADGRLGIDLMARRLAFDDQDCVDRNGKVRTDKDGKPLPCGFDLLRQMDGVQAVKLRAHPMRFDLPSNAAAMSNIQQLLRTGWGDGESATPLAMVTAYASIGREKLVRPSIVRIKRRPDGCPEMPLQGECGDLLEDWPRATNLFKNVRAGLHAVAMPGGSGAAAFNDSTLRMMPDGRTPRLFIKTGTATYRAVNPKTGRVSNYFTLWLAGWVEGVGNTPIPERLAFACMITRGTGNDTGGGTCARLIRRFLDNLSPPSRPR